MKMEAETTKSPLGSDTSPLDTCGICKELFHSRDPKLLPCLHSFCRSCIAPKANEQGNVTCPMCQTESRLADMVDWLCASKDRGSAGNGASTGSEEGPAQEEVHICTGCEENATASSYCTDCPEWLCDQCVQAHRRVRVTKDHTIEPKEKVTNRPNSASSSASSSSSSQPPLFCPQHVNEPLKLFCETCDKLTCRDCQLSEHKDHKYQFVNEASAQYKQFLQILLSKIKEKQTYIENAYQLIHKRHQEIEEREKVVLNDIKSFAKRLMSEVNNRGKQLVTDLHSICTAKKAQLGYKQKAIVTLSGQLAHSLMIAEKILDSNNTAGMLSSKKLLVQHLKHLLRTRCEVPNPYHVVDINLQYSEEQICTYLSKQGALVVDGVTFRGSKGLKPSKSPATATSGPNHGSTQQGQPLQQRPLQPIAPKVMHGQGPAPSLSSLTLEQRATLMKSIAAKHLQTGSSSPTSTMTNPLFPNSAHPPASGSTAVHTQGPATSSNSGGSSPAVLGKRFQPFIQVPQSNTVSSTQVVKTGGVYYPPSGLAQPQQQGQQTTQQKQQAQDRAYRRPMTIQQQIEHQQQKQQSQQSNYNRPLTVQQQLEHQRQRLHEQQNYQQRYKQHMGQIKQQMDKMVMEFQRHQQNANGKLQGPPGQSQGTGQHGTGRPLQQQHQGMGNPSMTNAIIIQPASSTGHYPISSTQPGLTGQTCVGNGRDQLTPSPNLRTSPLSQGSRNEVSPVGSLNEGHTNTSDMCVTGVKLNSTVPSIKQEQVDMYTPMIGPDGTLCIKPEPQTPGTEPLGLPYPTEYDDGFLTELRSNTEISDSAVETTQRTPPPSQQYGASQDQPYNLCKPITDQVIGSQPEADGALDLSCTGDSNKDRNFGSQPVLGTINLQSDEGKDAPLPLRDPDDPSEDYCAVCQNGGELLCCDTCPKVFHLSCHIPTLSKEPSGPSWSCALCIRDSDLKIEAALPRPAEQTGAKRKMSMERLLAREMKVCQRILLELFCHKSSPLFHEPVPKSVPNYHKIISTPMDLGTVKSKLCNNNKFHRYITIDDFLGDLQLIWTNCTVFNDPGSEVGKAGKIMEAFFHDLVNKYLPYFRAWTASPHDSEVKEGPKAKRRKRDPSGKDSKDAKGQKEKSLQLDGLQSRSKSPLPRDKAPRKNSNKPLELTPQREEPLPAQSEPDRDPSPAVDNVDPEDALISNLGLVRNQSEQLNCVNETEPEPEDLPSDPIVDPCDDDKYPDLEPPMDIEDSTKEVAKDSEKAATDQEDTDQEQLDKLCDDGQSNSEKEKVMIDNDKVVAVSEHISPKEEETPAETSVDNTGSEAVECDKVSSVEEMKDVSEEKETNTSVENIEKPENESEKDKQDVDSSMSKKEEDVDIEKTIEEKATTENPEPMETDLSEEKE